MRANFWINLTLLVFLNGALPTYGQTEKVVWEASSSGKTVSFRGVCAISAQACWVSGTKGIVLRTTDAGKTWESVGPANCESLDFRDIEAWDELTAVIMSSGEEDRIYRTEDGGKTWSLVFEHPNRAAFFDGFAFADTNTGWLMGDPIDGQLLILKTIDGGRTWTELPRERLPAIEAGEAGFAASGTNIAAISSDSFAIALGGAKPGDEFERSRIVSTKDDGVSWTVQIVPLRRSEAGGIFSICRLSTDSWAAVGGNYKQADVTSQTAALTRDGGISWKSVNASSPSGYRSCVAAGLDSSENPILITVGPNGTDTSRDQGETWQRAADEGFHALDFSPDRKAGWAAGSDGRIARWRGE
jgi:photosystem II stability/assembly factor-like uncharacterized protein